MINEKEWLLYHLDNYKKGMETYFEYKDVNFFKDAPKEKKQEIINVQVDIIKSDKDLLVEKFGESRRLGKIPKEKIDLKEENQMLTFLTDLLKKYYKDYLKFASTEGFKNEAYMSNKMVAVLKEIIKIRFNLMF